MPFIPFADGCQIVLRFTQMNQIVENVFWMKGTAPYDATTLDETLVAWQSWETDVAAPIRCVNTKQIQVRARAWDTDSSPEVERTSSIIGHLTGEGLPNHCTLAVKAVTGLAGRSFRGRSFWIGLPETALDTGDSNQIGADATGAILTAMNALLTSITWPNGGKIVVASQRHNGADRAAILATPVMSYQLVDSFVDSQRRRLPGHNRHR